MTVATLATEPLTAPLRVTAHAIPDPEPPYDGADDGPVAGAGDGDGVRDGFRAGDAAPAAAARPLPPCPPAPDPGSPGLRLVPPPEPGDAAESFDPVRTPRPDLEDPLPRAAMLARAVLEALSGVRPVTQLTRWLTPEVLEVVQGMVANRVTRPYPTALRRVLVSEPMPGVAEVTAVIDRGSRVEALALRLEGLDGRWLVTALQRA